MAYQQSCGVYLSKSWLSETFREIITTDIMENAHCDKNNADTLVVVLGGKYSNKVVTVLLQILLSYADIDGLGHGQTREEDIPNFESGNSANFVGTFLPFFCVA